MVSKRFQCPDFGASEGMRSQARTISRVQLLSRFIAWIFAALLVIILVALRWGDDWLIASDPTAGHVDAAVVLEGAVAAYETRLAGAMALVARGSANRVLLSLPRESKWGQSVPPVARDYLERTYGVGLAARVDFCDMDAWVNSTEQESVATLGCIEAHHWRSVAVITSNYHTRRAGILWRRSLRRQDSKLELSIHGVADPEFQTPWWRHRPAAEIWLMESQKLVWTMLGG